MGSRVGFCGGGRERGGEHGRLRIEEGGDWLEGGWMCWSVVDRRGGRGVDEDDDEDKDEEDLAASSVSSSPPLDC